MLSSRSSIATTRHLTKQGERSRQLSTVSSQLLLRKQSTKRVIIPSLYSSSSSSISPKEDHSPQGLVQYPHAQDITNQQNKFFYYSSLSRRRIPPTFNHHVRYLSTSSSSSIEDKIIDDDDDEDTNNDFTTIDSSLPFSEQGFTTTTSSSSNSKEKEHDVNGYTSSSDALISLLEEEEEEGEEDYHDINYNTDDSSISSSTISSATSSSSVTTLQEEEEETDQGTKSKTKSKKKSKKKKKRRKSTKLPKSSSSSSTTTPTKTTKTTNDDTTTKNTNHHLITVVTTNTTTYNVTQSQLLQHTQRLFDTIAPHTELQTWTLLRKRMINFIRILKNEIKEYQIDLDSIQNNITEDDDDDGSGRRRKKRGMKGRKRKKVAQYKTINGRIDAFFMEPKKKKKNDTTNNNNNNNTNNDMNDMMMMKKKPNHDHPLAYDKTILEDKDRLDTHPWIRSLIVRYFYSAQSNIKKNIHPSYGPNINRNDLDHNVDILMKARDLSFQSPLLWSNSQRKKVRYQRKHGKEWDKVENVDVDVTNKDDSDVDDNNKDDDEEKEEGEEVEMMDDPDSIQEKIQNNYSQKSHEQLESEARAIASILADRLPPRAHKDLLQVFEEYAATTTDDDDDDDDDSNSTTKEEETSTKSRKMRMLYTYLKRCTGPHIHLIASDLVRFFNVDVPQSMLQQKEDGDLGSSSGDTRIYESWKEWNINRDQIVKSSMKAFRAYHELLHTYEQLVEAEKQREKTPQEKEEEDLELEVSSAADMNQKKQKKLVMSKKKRFYVTYQCNLLNERFGPYSHQDSAFMANFSIVPSMKTPTTDQNSVVVVDGVCPDLQPYLPETNKMISIDNLPIDVTEEELHYLYSRCGKLKSIKIYNQRPDLDPGEPTEMEKRKKRRNARLQGGKAGQNGRGKNNGRPRTPVYAILTFETEDAYKSATIDMLRIFGMVIRRHPVRSIPSHTLHSISIENLPPGTFPLDLENRINSILKPDMEVFLNLGNNDKYETTNCHLNFPTFEVAHYAMELLKKADFEENGCQIHWIKTPEDAMDYWTREKTSFDP